MKGITDIAYNKQQEYKDQYVKWCIENPGQIFNGLSSKELGAKYAAQCENIKELETLSKIFLKMNKSTESINGFRFMHEAVEEIISDVKLKAEKEYFL